MDWLSKPHSSCRVCSAPLGAPYLSLGEQPLANALVDPNYKSSFIAGADVYQVDPNTWKFPLQVILCDQCGLSQLSVVVNPEILYSGYRFRSGASESWRAHCEELAKRCTKEFGDFPPKRVLDVAANDGTQLKAFSRRGWLAMGIDPAPAHDAVMVGSWPDAARYFLPPNFHPPVLHDLVIAQNVLGHVDDPIGFLRACKTVLAPEGRVVVEVPHVNSLIVKGAFDTVYHEHLSYWSYEPLDYAAEQAGLVVKKWDDLPDIHGGSTRFWLGHATSTDKPLGPTMLLAYTYRREYASIARRVKNDLDATDSLLRHNTYQKEFLGWGASAKATVYLNAIGRGEIVGLPSAIIDDTPEKQGMLLPGVHIPIIPCPESLADVDVIWCLSWNNFDAIARKAKARGFAGKFLLTNGTPRLVDA